jgi:hypothetical protein
MAGTRATTSFTGAPTTPDTVLGDGDVGPFTDAVPMVDTIADLATSEHSGVDGDVATTEDTDAAFVGAFDANEIAKSDETVEIAKSGNHDVQDAQVVRFEDDDDNAKICYTPWHSTDNHDTQARFGTGTCLSHLRQRTHP